MKKNKTPKTSTTGYPAKKHFPILVAAKNDATRRERIEKISTAFWDRGNPMFLKKLKEAPFAFFRSSWFKSELGKNVMFKITRRERPISSIIPICNDPIRWGNISKFSI